MQQNRWCLGMLDSGGNGFGVYALSQKMCRAAVDFFWDDVIHPLMWRHRPKGVCRHITWLTATLIYGSGSYFAYVFNYLLEFYGLIVMVCSAKACMSSVRSRFIDSLSITFRLLLALLYYLTDSINYRFYVKYSG